MAIGPLVIPNDRASRRYGDGENIVVAANDPHGFADDPVTNPAAINSYYSRFWSSRPTINVSLDYSPLIAQSGQYIESGEVQFTLKTVSGRVITQTQVINLSSFRWRSFGGKERFVEFLTLTGSDNFGLGSTIVFDRTQTGSGTSRALTRLQMWLELSFTFLHQTDQAEKDGLILDARLDFSASPLSSAMRSAILTEIEIEGGTQT